MSREPLDTQEWAARLSTTMGFLPDQPRDPRGRWWHVPGWARFGDPITQPDSFTKANPHRNGWNCSNSTVAVEMRRRGWRVTAKAVDGQNDPDALGPVSQIFKGPESGPKFLFPKSIETMDDDPDWPTGNDLGHALQDKLIEQYPVGARGYVSFAWLDDKGMPFGGNHVINWEIDQKRDGTPRMIVYDGQAGTGAGADTAVGGFWYGVWPDLMYGRLDNAELTREGWKGLEDSGE